MKCLLSLVIAAFFAVSISGCAVLSRQKSPPSQTSNADAPTTLATGPETPKGDPLAVIVNRKNPVENLTLAELRKLCPGEWKDWPQGGHVTMALRERGQPEHDAVLRQVFRMNESSFRRLLLDSSNEEQNAAKELASAKHVCRFVFNVPGAIGFVRASEADDSVKVIRLDGLAINDPAYKLRLPAP